MKKALGCTSCMTPSPGWRASVTAILVSALIRAGLTGSHLRSWMSDGKVICEELKKLAKPIIKPTLRREVWQLWMKHSLQLHGAAPLIVPPEPPHCSWRCELCDQTFLSKRALAMHAVKIHDYQAVVKHYAVDGMCANCGRLFHCRARLCAHLRHSTECLQRIRAAFPALANEEIEQLNELDRQYAREMKQQGWLPTKAKLPVSRAYGPSLPPADSEDAAVMLRKWTQRQETTSSVRFEGLAGVCTQIDDRETMPHFPPVASAEHTDLCFIMHSVHGEEHGHHGCFSMAGLARLYASLHLKTLCFIHFFSGYRREGDLQHQIDNHFIQGHYHIFCISIDFCLQGGCCDLTTSTSRTFWTKQIQSGAVFGVGGGPPCEFFCRKAHGRRATSPT